MEDVPEVGRKNMPMTTTLDVPWADYLELRFAFRDAPPLSDLLIYLARSALNSLSLLSPIRLLSLVLRFGHIPSRTCLLKPPLARAEASRYRGGARGEQDKVKDDRKHNKETNRTTTVP